MAIAVLMPALSPTMTKGNLVKWHKKEGDHLTSGMILADIETDKATMEIEVVDEGILGKILVAEGTPNVEVQSVIALIAEAGEDLATLTIPSNIAAPLTEASVAPANLSPEPIKPAPSTPDMVGLNDRILASPLAKRTAQLKGVDLRNVEGTGPKGRIVQADVLGANTTSKKPRPAAEWTDTLNSDMRHVIAERLSASKREAPHFYLNAECDMDAVVRLRHDINSSSAGVKLSLNDFVIRAVSLALRDVPELNVSWMGNSIRTFHDVHVAVAVSIPGGLVTPVVRNTDEMRLRDLSAKIRKLAEAARAGQLRVADFQGGTMTVSNLGMYGVSSFNAIINPPQAAILAVGAVEKRAVVRNGLVVPGDCMNCTLSVDHRAVDGADAARWLQVFRNYMEAPTTLLFDMGL